VRSSLPLLWRCAVAVMVGVLVAVLGFLSDTRPIVVGAHSGTVSPAVDGWATLELGGLFPALRTPSGLPLSLGVQLAVNSVERDTLQEVITADAVIASAPDGEIAKVRSALIEMAAVHAVRGAGVAIVVAVVLLLLRRRSSRREDHIAGPGLRQRLRGLGGFHLGLAAVVSLALVVIALPGITRPEERPRRWVPLADLFPSVLATEELEEVEVVDGPQARGAASLVQAAVNSYTESLDFYGRLPKAFRLIADRLHPLEDGDVLALHVSDRHDNIGMDQLIEAVIDIAGVTVVLDSGDDTSSGSPWETFSLDSLAAATDGAEVVAVAGNHDKGDSVATRMQELGFTVLNGEPVNVAGIRFLGDSDPRGSGLTSTYTPGEETVTEQGARLADVACEDEGISTVVVHSPTSGLRTAERGCAALVVSGHLHRQVGPTAVTAPDGFVATTYTGGTTGGAAYAFALGTTLRQPAQMTLITYRDGSPIGLQALDVDTGGQVSLQPWASLPPSRPGLLGSRSG
jgi:predicted phosphodiesterase